MFSRRLTSCPRIRSLITYEARFDESSSFFMKISQPFSRSRTIARSWPGRSKHERSRRSQNVIKPLLNSYPVFHSSWLAAPWDSAYSNRDPSVCRHPPNSSNVSDLLLLPMSRPESLVILLGDDAGARAEVLERSP